MVNISIAPLVPYFPCTNIAKTIEFYLALGFEQQESCDPNSSSIAQLGTPNNGPIVILLTNERFSSEFGPFFAIHDAQESIGAVYSLQVEKKSEADAITNAAGRVSGRFINPQAEEGKALNEGHIIHSGHYARSVADPDGRVWEVLALEGVDDHGSEGVSNGHVNTKHQNLMNGMKVARGVMGIAGALGGGG